MKDNNQFLTSIIIDDEADARERMACLLEKCEHIKNLGSVARPVEAIEKIKQHNPELLFVDVEMPEMSGFELVSQLHEANLRPHIVFVTGYSQYAIKAIKAGAFDFLLKPVDIDELREMAERVLNKSDRQLNKDEPRHVQVDRVRFNTRSGFKLVDPADILYCEADGAYTIVHLKDGSEITESTYLSVVEKKLPNGKFIRISRSFLVNIAQILRVDRKRREIVIQRSEEEIILNLSKRYFSYLDKHFN